MMYDYEGDYDPPEDPREKRLAWLIGAVVGVAFLLLVLALISYALVSDSIYHPPTNYVRPL